MIYNALLLYLGSCIFFSGSTAYAMIASCQSSQVCASSQVSPQGALALPSLYPFIKLEIPSLTQGVCSAEWETLVHRVFSLASLETGEQWLIFTAKIETNEKEQQAITYIVQALTRAHKLDLFAKDLFSKAYKQASIEGTHAVIKSLIQEPVIRACLENYVKSDIYAVNKERISTYIGEHVYTNDYAAQENIRQIDLRIEQWVKDAVDKAGAETFFVNGWGQVIATLYILEAEKAHQKISSDFYQYASKEIAKALAKAQEHENPFFNCNVKSFSRPILMYPHSGIYHPFKKIELSDEPLIFLNSYIKEVDVKFELFEGKLFLKFNARPGKEGIFTALWKTNFSNLLTAAGFTMQPNKFSAHITLTSSAILAQIRQRAQELYGNRWQEEYDAFFKKVLEALNAQLQVDHPVIFAEPAANYSEDASPFGEIVVAKVHSPIVEKALQKLVVQVQEKFGIALWVQDAHAFHVTLAVHYRQPQSLPFNTFQELLLHIGKYSSSLLNWWNTFLKTYSNH